MQPTAGVEDAPDRVIVVKGIGGLGNRILALLTTCLYARMTDRTLYVDWRDECYSDDGENAFPRLFRSPCCRPYRDGVASGTVRPDVWTDRLDLEVSDLKENPPYATVAAPWRVLSTDISRLDHPEDTLVVWSYFEAIRSLRRHFTGRFRHLRGKTAKAVLRTLHSECLSLSPDIQARVDRFREDHRGPVTIGVHVRSSDVRSRSGPIRRRLESLLARHPGAQVFLATDNYDVLREFRSRYSRVVSTDKWYPDPGAPMHNNSDCPDKAALSIEGLVDLHLLASWDYLVCDESSSFAYVASLLFDGPPDRIYNSQRGRHLPPDLRHWIWVAWVRIRGR